MNLPLQQRWRPVQSYWCSYEPLSERDGELLSRRRSLIKVETCPWGAAQAALPAEPGWGDGGECPGWVHGKQAGRMAKCSAQKTESGTHNGLLDADKGTGVPEAGYFGREDHHWPSQKLLNAMFIFEHISIVSQLTRYGKGKLLFV